MKAQGTKMMALVLVACVGAGTQACSTASALDRDGLRALDGYRSGPPPVERVVRAIDGDEVVFDRQASLVLRVGDRQMLRGDLEALDITGNVLRGTTRYGQLFEVPLDSIQQVEVRQLSGGRTLLFVVGMLVGTAVVTGLAVANAMSGLGNFGGAGGVAMQGGR